jgi:hypothetical protein
MAIPSTPRNFYTTQGNGQAYAQWDLVAGATSYSVERSTDGVTFSVLATPTTPYYLDASITIGIQYYYQVASVNSSGTSPYTNAQSVVPCISGELSLGEIRTRAQQRADRLNGNFVTLPEWNFFIIQAMYELYDLLINADEEYFVAAPAYFKTNGSQQFYALPDGTNTFQDASGANFIPKPFYKLKGVDLGLGNAGNGFVTVGRFEFADRNRYIYPNTASTIYGVFNLQYRLMGKDLELIPTPSANQPMRLWYVPRLKTPLADADMSDIGISGWLQYVIVRAAKYALDKEESDTTKLDQELNALNTRIASTAANRDQANPARISDTRTYNGGGMGGQGGYGPNGAVGGW